MELFQPPMPLPRLLGLIILYSLLAGIYTTVTPPFEKPDENWHFAMTLYLMDNGHLPLNTTDAPPHYARQQANQPPLYYMILAPIWRIAGLTDLTDGFLRLSKENEFKGIYHSPFPTDNNRLFIEGRCDGACASAKTALFIGRIVSAFYVGLAISISAWTIQTIFPNDRTLALMTSAMMAFNPQMLHIGSSLSNDSLAILWMSLGFYLAAQWMMGNRSNRMILLMGVVAGAAILTKLSAGTLGLLFGVMILLTSPQRIKHIFLFGSIALLICGWWFVHNQIHYGDITALNAHIQTAPQAAPPQTLKDLLAQVPAVIQSFWAEFGWGQIRLSETLYQGIITLSVLAFITGLVSLAVRWRKQTHHQRQFFVFILSALVITVALLIRWMTTTQAPHGRLLFPVILPISLLLALGIVWVFPARWQQQRVFITSTGLFLFALLLPFQVILPSYTPPEPITSQIQQPTFAIYFEREPGIVALQDIALRQTEDWLYIQLSWEIGAEFQNDYAVFIHILDADGNIIRQRDSYPGLSHQPFTRLGVGDISHDVYPIPSPPTPIQTVVVGIYNTTTWERLHVVSETFTIDTDSVKIPIEQVRIIEG
jgi:4-amino-4-deoxy-L-arabinose transferase-like glycosyltransferase